jgi:hypothetical protein
MDDHILRDRIDSVRSRNGQVYFEFLIVFAKCFSFRIYASFLGHEVHLLQTKVKVTAKLFLCLTKHHAMKTYRGSGGIATRILNLGCRWRWVVSFTPWPLYLRGKSSSYPLDRRLGEPQSQSGAVAKRRATGVRFPNLLLRYIYCKVIYTSNIAFHRIRKYFSPFITLNIHHIGARSKLKFLKLNGAYI